MNTTAIQFRIYILYYLPSGEGNDCVRIGTNVSGFCMPLSMYRCIPNEYRNTKTIAKWVDDVCVFSYV